MHKSTSKLPNTLPNTSQVNESWRWKVSQEDTVSYIMLSVEGKTRFSRVERWQTAFRRQSGRRGQILHDEGHGRSVLLRKSEKEGWVQCGGSAVRAPLLWSVQEKPAAGLQAFTVEEMGQNIGEKRLSVLAKASYEPMWGKPSRHKDTRREGSRRSQIQGLFLFTVKTLKSLVFNRKKNGRHPEMMGIRSQHLTSLSYETERLP